MSLSFDRAALKYHLLGGTAFNNDQQALTLRIINKWWGAYKLWEAQDRFLPAFNEGRMTVRQIPLEGTTYGEYLGQDSGIAFGARRGDVERAPYPKERYRVGIDALKERMDPANFGMDGAERLKYQRGLHDLSASLCVPTIPLLTKQVRWKWDKIDKCYTIFMPLAQPEDMAIFDLLNRMAKQAPQEIRNRVAELRRQFTRLKLADSVDIGAGLHDISPKGSTDPKFRYGMKNVPDWKGAPTGIDAIRAQKALDYTSILPTGPKASNINEIVIAYRHHEGVRFPLFTKFNKEANAFLCFPDEPSSQTIIGKEIPDNWARTVEV